ncbi:YIP1 family protein [Candidatus Bathyarchaeota archaeon]|nr:YIP1 family protein [Candidatus Bathyarchaeota archaeon]
MSEDRSTPNPLRCLINPLDTLSKVDERDLWIGLVVVLLIAFLASTARYNYAMKLPIEIPEFLQRPGSRVNPETFKRNIAYFQAFSEGATTILNWLLTSILIHLYTRALGGRGSLRRLMAKAGFASTPLLIQQLLRLIDSYTITGENLLELIASLQSWTPRILTHISLFQIWLLILLIIAASTNYRTSKRRAAASTLLAYLTLLLIPLLSHRAITMASLRIVLRS